MMAHVHMQQNMRAMGTHTLGRLPSHNHSPTHMTGKLDGDGRQCIYDFPFLSLCMPLSVSVSAGGRS